MVPTRVLIFSVRGCPTPPPNKKKRARAPHNWFPPYLGKKGKNRHYAKEQRPGQRDTIEYRRQVSAGRFTRSITRNKCPLLLQVLRDVLLLPHYIGIEVGKSEHKGKEDRPVVP